ncbi:MAG: TrkH family potassium uptake protein [Lachnospiraceae bacterium]|nr:TrkH family potassium uptake protein [Lachnospiraceae bacterium]
MNKSIIRYILSRVLQFEAVFLLLPVIVSLIYKEKDGICFLIVSLCALALGTLGSRFLPKSKVFYAREGFVTVSLSWILISLVGAIPFVITGAIPSYVDAVFETVSGFTTTGASILTDVEAMSYTCMFWRCFTNWIGGMGVLVFIMAVVPLSGSHNMHLMKAESPGPDVGKLVPKVKDTAKILYGMYMGLTGVLIISLLIAKVPLFDAFVLSFSTMGTGGFGRWNASLGAYSTAVQTITIIFMILCGVNFNAYFLIIKGKIKDFFKIEEIRTYLLILLAGAVVITLLVRGNYSSYGEAFHHASFQIASIMSTTGFSTADFDLWPTLAKTILVCTMVIGGCAGATAGGIKVSRLLLLFRTIGRELSHLTHPRSVRKIRMDSQPVLEETIKGVQSFFIAYAILVILSTIIVSIDNFDFQTSFTSVISMAGNIGPGLGMVGPTGNYSQFSDCSKIVLIFDMLAGRLEIFPMLVLFYAGTWRKS